jgi:DnaD/phage-associated family protein
MANEGFIKLYRKMLEWGWYDDGPTKDVFIHLLLIASYEDKFYRGIPLERGQVVTTVKEMEVKLGLTTRQIRTALSKLISTNEVTKKSTSKFTIYTINNYADYQACDKQNDKRATNERQTSDKPSNTKKVRSKEYIATTAASDAGCDLHNQDLSDCIQCYEQNCGSIPRAVSDEIKAALQKFPSAIICQAIEEAAVHNSRRWSYISQILARCEQEGIYTVEAFKAKRDSAKATRTTPRQTDAAAAMERLKQLAKGVTTDD